MDKGGSFHITNIGKAPIFVNSKEVPCNECTHLISDALLQVSIFTLIFLNIPALLDSTLSIPFVSSVKLVV